MFPGFLAADFDAYDPKKWKSNVFNRERLEVKQRLLVFARDFADLLIAADGSPLTVEASVEHPALWNHKQVEAQHLFFSRNEGARKELDAIIDRQKSLASMIEDPTPQRNHLFMAVSLQHGAIDLAVKLHPDARVDRQNLERKCEDHFEREKLLHLIRELGPGVRVGVSPELTPASEIDEARLKQALGELALLAGATATHAPVPPRLFYIGQSIARDQALAAGASMVAMARDRFADLHPIYLFIAWSRDNDFVSIREVLQKEKLARRQKGLQLHDHVRIVRGMLAGKTGVVQEIDGKGGLKLIVGKMAVKVAAEDVAKA